MSREIFIKKYRFKTRMREKNQQYLNNLDLLLQLKSLPSTRGKDSDSLRQSYLRESVEWAEEKGFVEEKYFSSHFGDQYFGYVLTPTGEKYLEQCAQNPPREWDGFRYDFNVFTEIVGEELAEKLFNDYGDQQKAMKWFYEWRIDAYDNMTPFELFNIDKDNLEGILEADVI